ncbi:glutamine--fructose-6-phosphate aminotransferase [isomerizing] [Clostridia bacterium]|nr:glutamine--fructose-6-phosphate aminotransferase [isomerizing] [Clostridia bacterium]
MDYCYGEGVSPLSAIAAAAGQMRGSFAFALLFKGAEGVIYAARRGSPLIIGLGEGENFLASDIPAILKYTRNYYILEENEIAAVSADGVSVYDADLAEVKKELMTATWDVEAAEKGGYPHFMLKEIMEQPRALRDTISPRVQNGKVVFEDAELLPRLKKAERIFIVACGTAMYAGTAGRYAIEQLARIPVTVDAASEFRYRDPVIGARDSVIIISQSGETADTLAALRLAKSKGAFVVGIVNVVGSSIAREADCALITAAGPEISVASTKAYSVQVAMLMLLASGLSGDGITADLLKLPEQVEKITESENIEHYQYVASKYQNAKHIFYIGRNLDYALSMEGALKLKELAYTHSEAYAAGELKHGPIALIEKGTPVIAAATQNRLFEKTASNIKEVLARGAKVLLICQKGHGDLEELCEDVCELPEVPDILAPMLGIVPLQLFAYYTAVLKGCDVDKPRNLAKSVTVE